MTWGDCWPGPHVLYIYNMNTHINHPSMTSHGYGSKPWYLSVDLKMAGIHGYYPLKYVTSCYFIGDLIHHLPRELGYFPTDPTFPLRPEAETKPVPSPKSASRSPSASGPAGARQSPRGSPRGSPRLVRGPQRIQGIPFGFGEEEGVL